MSRVHDIIDVTILTRVWPARSIISELQQVYDREISFVQWENSDFPNFLESTGVLIMDRKRRICYIALSQRANKRVCCPTCLEPCVRRVPQG